MTVFFIILIHLIFTIVYRFASNPTVTSIEYRTLENMQMPQILVCQDRSFRLKFLEERNISRDLAKYILRLLSYLYMSKKLNKEAEQLEEEYQNLLDAYPRRDVRQLFFEGGPNCSDMFVECTHSFSPLNCCQWAKEVLYLGKGKCFLFDTLEAQMWPGSGFNAKIRLEPEAYFSGDGAGSGISLLIFPSYNAFQSYRQHITITPGYRALFELDKKVTISSNSILRTVCNGSAEKMRPKIDCIDECIWSERSITCGCNYAGDVSALQREFFKICSPKERYMCDERFGTILNQVNCLH